MVELKNNINFNFLDVPKKSKSFIIIILLNWSFDLDIYIHLYKLSDLVICADGASNKLYDLNEERKYLFLNID